MYTLSIVCVGGGCACACVCVCVRCVLFSNSILSIVCVNVDTKKLKNNDTISVSNLRISLKKA